MEQRDLEMFAEIVSKAIDPVKEKINDLDKKFDSLDEKFTGIDEKFAGIDEKLDGIDEKLAGIDEKFAGIDEKFDEIDEKFTGLDKKVDNIDLQVRDIKLSLENEVNPKINIIAEGHSILNRKLDEYMGQVLNVQDEREQLKLRMIYLESELAKVKERLNSLTSTA